ncbi:MAG: hypothetical protein IIW43_00130, partial [Selenomonadales bacterium]|nr:hypothetical protein [Selenomonadales bacterium]
GIKHGKPVGMDSVRVDFNDVSAYEGIELENKIYKSVGCFSTFSLGHYTHLKKDSKVNYITRGVKSQQCSQNVRYFLDIM